MWRLFANRVVLGAPVLVRWSLCCHGAGGCWLPWHPSKLACHSGRRFLNAACGPLVRMPARIHRTYLARAGLADPAGVVCRGSRCDVRELWRCVLKPSRATLGLCHKWPEGPPSPGARVSQLRVLTSAGLCFQAVALPQTEGSPQISRPRGSCHVGSSLLSLAYMTPGGKHQGRNQIELFDKVINLARKCG